MAIGAPEGQRAGILLRLLSVFLVTVMSALVYAVGKEASLGQIMFWRSAVALVPICLWLALRGDFPRGLGTRRPGLHLTRGLFGAAAMAMSFLSLVWLPVANALALTYLAPVLSLPMAALLLAERPGPRLYLAVGLGVAGMLLILWQSLQLPGQTAHWGIAAGLGYAVTMAFVRVHIKAMTRTESTAAIAFWFAVVCAGIGLAADPSPLAGPDRGALALLVAAGLIGGAGHIASTEAVRRAPVSAVAPYDFTGLVWALGIDLAVWGLLPGWTGLAGMAVILVAALIASGVLSWPRRGRDQAA
ncbi:DMT family transporter [Oceanicola sp. S124]|uniref:DMT family transporter n=1 Tax=Oceanicola sp. S124 TaxID=1042378 RepID=UPI0002557CFC|nr:DMT family transporter [Oceanicola sp. S124]